MTESFNTVGAIRSEVIYVPWKIRKSLGYLAQAQGTTREALAEAILGDWLEKNHPAIGVYLDKRQKEDKEFQKTITTIPFSSPAETLLNQLAKDQSRLNQTGVTP